MNFLGSKLEILLAGVIALAIACAACYWRGDVHGKLIATAQSAKALQVETDAKATDDATIASLQRANAAYAAQAQASDARAKQALAAYAAEQTKLAAARAAAQNALTKAEHANPAAQSWAETRVPAAVLRALGVRQ